MTDAAARRYGCRPSALLGLDDPWECLIFDATCATQARESMASAGEIPAMLAAMGVI